jgi:cyclophilin family peptidyl-prolyl cis-trans isomerase/HEAT repeat protein
MTSFPLSISTILLLLLVSCSPSKEFEDPLLQNPEVKEIILLKDKRDSKGLIPYFLSEDLQAREQAALAFGSIQDTLALNSLYTMIEEKEPIAQAAAFAIGQTGQLSSVDPLQRILERSMQEETRFEMYDAIGKCGEIDINYFLASSYNSGKDARGISWALMELAFKKQINQAGIQLAYAILENEYDYQIRLAAATALAHSGLELPWRKSFALFQKENIHDVKSVLALTIKSIPDAELNSNFMSSMKSSYFLTQINLFRAISGRSNDELIAYATLLIGSEENINLRIAAAEYLSSIPGESTHFLYQNKYGELNWRLQAILMDKAIEENNPRFIEEALEIYQSSDNLYLKGMLLRHLGKLPGKLEWLMHEIVDHDSIVTTYGMEALVELIAESEEKESLVPYFMETLDSDQDAVISLTAIGLRYESLADAVDVQRLIEKQAGLQMPQQAEAYLELEKTIRLFDQKSGPMPTILYNHPIDESKLGMLDSLYGFRVKTTRGDFMIEVYPEDAPGTLLTLIELVENGYYDQKLFHRVVPNFVAQTGCPDGDGWGGQEFSLRSEFSRRRYERGSVGMASAGKDSESCQWFVTHSPTPHLNGKYTLFGQVVDGLDVIDKLEIGDRIVEMKSVYTPL